jgi:hypothetical protein
MIKRDDQGFWNFVISVIFVGLVALSEIKLSAVGKLPTHISGFDFLLIALATFRLIRLFVYDKITQFFRDFFVKKEIVDGFVIRDKYRRGPLRTISDLLDCPWCMGVWAVLPIAYCYFLTPVAWYPIFLLAVAGVASLLQLFGNLLGWSAEYLKGRSAGM